MLRTTYIFWHKITTISIKFFQDDDNRNKAVFKGDFYLTGDRGKMDGDDYIWFIGRDDDVMLSSGYA